MTLHDHIATARLTGYAQVPLADLERWQKWIAHLQRERDAANERTAEVREQADRMVRDAQVYASHVGPE